MDLNHRPLGYEANRINDSITFQRLDAAGNDIKSLKRQQSTVIGPQSDHGSALGFMALEDVNDRFELGLFAASAYLPLTEARLPRARYC